MNTSKMKAILITACCFIVALCSEIKCMDTVLDVLENGNQKALHESVVKKDNGNEVATTSVIAGKELIWEGGRVVPKVGISDSPALAVFQDRLYCAYKWSGGKNRLAFTSTADGSVWEGGRVVSKVGISGSPALAVFQDRLYCAYKWSDGENRLAFTSTADGSVWEGGRVVPKVGISGSPALAVFQGKISFGYNQSEEQNRFAFKAATLIKFSIKESIIPLIAEEHEAIYKRFLNGKLVYKPDINSKVELRIADLKDPLNGTFDLSRCGNTGNYLSISTGYRKRKKPENASKLEIWFAPRFLIEKELNTTAAHFKPIMGAWNKEVPVGIFWTWGGWDNLGWYDYLVEHVDDNYFMFSDLYGRWAEGARTTRPMGDVTWFQYTGIYTPYTTIEEDDNCGPLHSICGFYFIR